jgi:2-polyprenyl-3-methyl-5-hydroxy-6-metoxy-1,4-benzoquinol methylase
MNRKVLADLLFKNLKNPNASLHVFKLILKSITEEGRASGRGERLVIKDLIKAKNTKDFAILAHIQRYEWCMSFLRGVVLDAGCGSGYGTFFLAKSDKIKVIIGVDVSFQAINFARKYFKSNNCYFLQMDVRELKFKDNYFDGIVSFDVPEHLSEVDQEKFVHELMRVLKPEGILIIGCPNAKVSTKSNPFHLKELTMSELQHLLYKYFNEVKIFGQDLIKQGRRAKEKWLMFINDISYNDLIIVEDNCDYCFGLLAICRKPKK